MSRSVFPLLAIGTGRLVLVGALLLSSACRQNPQSPPNSSQESPMALILKEVAAASDPVANVYLNKQRVESFETQLLSETDTFKKIRILSEYPLDLLRAGKPREAIVKLDEYLAMLESEDPEWKASTHANSEFFRATCYLRLAEQENCILHHSTDSCLFPIQGSGIHQEKEGATEALEILARLLEGDPNALKVRWLYNIAGMTLGKWPEDLNPKWVIPKDRFDSQWNIPRLPDVAKSAGVNTFGLAGGCVMEDLNGDGRLDLLVSSWGFEDPLTLLIQNDSGVFTNQSKTAGLDGITGGLNLIHADYDNDGDQDVLVLRGAWMGRQGRFPNSLLRNNGDSTFTDVTIESKILSFFPTQTAVWIDYNRDGWLDLFVGNESTTDFKTECELFENQKDGTFLNVAESRGANISRYVKAVVSADFNNDGWPDLFLSCLSEPNVLLLNRGNVEDGRFNPASGEKQFVNAAGPAGVQLPLHSFTAWAWDYDNDGWEDLWVSDYHITDVGDIAAEYLGKPNQAEKGRLFRNARDGTFQDVSAQTGMDRIFYAMGANFGDLDGDGFLDFYIGTGDPQLTTLMPNRFFRNAEGERFLDATSSAGLGHLQKGHGIAFGDWDEDGDLDLFAVMGGAFSGDGYWNALFENPGNDNAWIKLKLEGVRSNRSALGTRIRITVEDAPDGKSRHIFRTISTGGSFGSNPLTQHIGLGKCQKIKYLEIYWPQTDTMQVFKNPMPNQTYSIKETDTEW